MFSRPLYIFALLWISGVLGKKPCDLEDSPCLTKAADLSFTEFVAGRPNVPSSEPLFEPLIEANLPTIKYKLFDASLSGIKDCHVTLVKLNTKESKYDYHVGCPHLTLEAGYELSGEIDSKFVEGKGKCTVELYDYNFNFAGNYESKTKDGKGHIQLKTHVLDIDAKGKVHYHFGNLYNGDQQKSDEIHKHVNDNWAPVDKVLRKPTMDAFMDKHYINNVNAYLEEVPAEVLFSL